MWKNLNGYDNLFLEMLNQFEAVSYGDHLFGNFLLLPLQQGFPSRWKKLLLNDHSQALCFLGVPLSELIVPLKNYLEPYEMEFEVLVAYFKVLASGILTHRRCPLIYLMAVHHIHHYIFANQDINKKYQKFLLSSVLYSKKKDARLHVLLYCEVNLDAEHGFNLKTELSATQHEHLKNIMG
ncbi:RNA polymerase II-associated protein 1, partial [Stegodyphus mimosarum]